MNDEFENEETVLIVFSFTMIYKQSSSSELLWSK